MKNAVKFLIVALAFGATTCLVSAQQEGGRRGFDPEQFRERMMERMKEQLNASDAEWKVMEPLVDKVMTKQREAGAGRFGGMMMGMRGGPPNRGGDDQRQGDRRERRGPDRMGAPAEIEALRAALESEKTSAADLKAKMNALRESRKKSEMELKQAREDLRKVLTVRQEAQLVLMGMLD